VAGVPCKDTVEVVSTDMRVQDTPDRATLWMAQTPQVFRYRLLLDAHQRCTSDVTDDAMMVESLGYPVKMFLGAYQNLKVTTPDDLAVVEKLLEEFST
jgi:2-C-methyl-D-erythritol 4-phosphate cytidylyltransferase